MEEDDDDSSKFGSDGSDQDYVPGDYYSDEYEDSSSDGEDDNDCYDKDMLPIDGLERETLSPSKASDIVTKIAIIDDGGIAVEGKESSSLSSSSPDTILDLQRQINEMKGKLKKYRHLENCGICTNSFCSTPPKNPSDDDHRPVTLHCCGNTACVSCLEKDRIAKMERLNNRRRKNIACIWCKATYHCEKVQFATDKDRMAALTDTPSGDLLKRSLLNSGQGDSAVLMGDIVKRVTPNSINNGNDGVSRCDVVVGHDTGALPRPRTQNPQQHLVRSLLSEQTVFSSSTDDHTLSSEGSKTGNEQVSITSGNNVIDLTENDEENEPVRKKRHRNSSSLHTSISPEGKHGANNAGDLFNRLKDEEWLHKVWKKGMKLYRVRQFQKNCRTPEDRYGQACARWAVQKGYLGCSARAIPTSMLNDSAKSRDFLSLSVKDLAVARKVSTSKHFAEHWKKKSVNGYLNTYKKFAGVPKSPRGQIFTGDGDEHYSIQTGDVVALLISGPSKKGEAYFGVVASDELLLRTPDELRKEKFPAPHLFTDQVKTFNGLMLRRVRWMRKTMTRNLPYQKGGGYQVTWLAEGGPNWFAEIKPKSKKTESGPDIVRGTKFLKATEPI